MRTASPVPGVADSATAPSALAQPGGTVPPGGAPAAPGDDLSIAPAGHRLPTTPAVLQVASLAELTRLAGLYLPEEDLQRIREAYRVGDAAHLGQFRQSGEPYISHPIAVAETCARWKLDAESLMAALLHDVIEDTGVSKQELAERFGPQVADLVDGLSKLDKIEFASREVAQAESFRKMLLAMARDVRVILVKLADRLHNMATLDCVDRSKQVRVANETLEIYAPIASRLGLRKLYLELVDLAFRYRFPFRYRTLQRAVRAARGNRREVLSRILEAVQKNLPEAGVDAEVYGREKSLYGIYSKMLEKHISFSDVLDVYGFRIIVKDVPSCYLAMGVLHGTFKPVPGRFKDYIAIPKANGYQSLHTTLVGPFGTPIEFQIRTRDMQRVAESGVAAHWLYKAEKETFTDLQTRTHQWLQSLLDIQHQTGDSLEFIENVKVDLFPDSVYVFTPKGQIRALPRGATVIDFAYSVHTAIGDQTISATVNQQAVPLRTELQNGDVVEVITDPTSKPNPTWLGFARTGKARAEIRHSLKTMKYTESVELGRRLLEQSLASLRIDPAELDASVLEKGARAAGARSLEEIHADIGLGRQLAQVVARTIALQVSSRQVAALIMPSPAPIFVHGTEGSAVQYSFCCNAVPGDRIIGHLRGGQGLVIHRDECDNARRNRSRDGERWVDVEWADDVIGSFRSEIELLVRNERGALAKVAAELATQDANIMNITMDTESSETATVRLILQVRDRAHLANVMRSLRRIHEIKRIVRR